MPIYEYRRPDGSTFEVLQSFSDPPLKKDPETGVKVQRVLHAPAVHFKGKGFYNTDYGTRKRQRETAAAGEGGSNGAAADGVGSTDGASKADSGAGASKTGTGTGTETGAESKSKQPAKKDAKPVAATS
jgi:putative FmdB family regulatory protein